MATNKIFDIIVDRADYASDTAAGTALKTILESTDYNSVMIKDGTYDFGTNTVTLDTSINLIEGESQNSTILQTALTSGTLITTTSDINIRNFKFNSTGVVVSACTMIVATSADNIIIEGITFNSGTYYDDLRTVTGSSSLNTFVKTCYISGFGDGFSSIQGGISDIIFEDVGLQAFSNCNNIEGIKIKSFSQATGAMDLFSGCDNVSNVYIETSGDVSGTGKKEIFSSASKNISNIYISIDGKLESTDGNAYIFISCSIINTVYVAITSIEGSGGNAGVFYNCDQVSNFDVFADIAFTGTGGIFYATNNVSCGKIAVGYALTSAQVACGAGAAPPVVGELAQNYSSITVRIGSVTTSVSKGFENILNVSSCAVNSFGSDNQNIAYDTCFGLVACTAFGNTVAQRPATAFDSCEALTGCYAENCVTAYDLCITAIGCSSDSVTTEFTGTSGEIFEGPLTNIKTSESVDDEAEIALETGKAGFGFVQAGDNEEYAQFAFTAAGVVTLIQNSANVVNTDTDTNLCIYDAGSGIAIKNRLGAAKTIRYNISYS